MKELIGQEMRFLFAENKAKEGYVLVYDQVLKSVVAELWEEHAQMIYLMYDNMFKKHPFAADEFMYGHILGFTLTLVHAGKYPKVKIERVENGVAILKLVDPDGKESAGQEIQEGTAEEDELVARLTPDHLKMKH